MRTFCLASLTLLSLACGREGDQSALEPLLGVWRTDAPRYADRYLEIRRDALIFGQGEAGEQTSLLVGFERAEPFGLEHRFRLEYAALEDEHPRELVVFLHEVDGTLRFANQDWEWTRDAPRSR